MQLYELSQSSFYVAEAGHLIELAAAVGRSDATTHLQTRADNMRKLIANNMWDNQNKVFTNKYPTGGDDAFYRKISPTSFYPLMANASTDEQADDMMVHWLTNKSRFCINANYKTENEGRCYYGLPSISADDPTFPPLGYWRGYGARF
jgi:neutral trehalase